MAAGRISDGLPTRETIDLLGFAKLAGEPPPASADRDEVLPDIGLGRAYLPARELGRGGMGVVRLATQVSLCREVAVKTLVEHAGGPLAAQALVREARIAGGLEHPNVVPIHALGLDDEGLPALVMKRVEGIGWDEIISREADWDGAEVWSEEPLARDLEILIEVCNALDYAHDHGIVHRDLKPENVMLGRYGEVYLLDWGIAIAVDEVDPSDPDLPVVGTPAFMAPEMLDGVATRRTDVYQLGCLLHMVLTGEPRHGGRNAVWVMASVESSEPAVYLDEVPDALAALANQSTSADPERRPPSAAAFRQALRDFLEQRAALDLTRRALVVLQGEPGEDALLEARVALEQAERIHPGTPGVHEAMVLCQRKAAEVAIARGNPGGAANAVARLRALDPDHLDLPDLLGEIARLEALQAMARDLDPARGRSSRFLLLILVQVLVVLIASGLVVRARLGMANSLYSALAAPVVFAFGVAGVAWLLRDRLMVSEFNRRAVALMVIGLLAVGVHRLAMVLVGQPIEVAVVGDLVVLGAILGGAAVAMHRYLAVPAVLCFVGALVAATTPAAVPQVVLAMTLFVAVTLMATFVGGRGREE